MMPSWGEFSQILTGLAAMGAFVLSWRNSRKIDDVKSATNGLTRQLVATTKTEAHAAGVKEEKERQ